MADTEFAEDRRPIHIDLCLNCSTMVETNLSWYKLTRNNF